MQIIVGIDPGVHGAIAVMRGDAATVWDMPTVVRKIGPKEKRRVDAHGLARLLSKDALGECKRPFQGCAFVELAQASPQMGVSSAFGYGESFGIVIGILAHLGCPIRFVSSVKWKADFGLTVKGNPELGAEGHETKKAASLELARKLYPQLVAELNLAKHDGRAEAILIAHWGVELVEIEAAQARKEITF
jgi:hypothetical protein